MPDPLAAAPPVPAARDPGPSQPFLETSLADALSAIVFAGAGVLASGLLLPFATPGTRAALAAACAALGPLACAVERGRARPLSWLGAAAIAALAAGAHAGAWWWVARQGPAHLAWTVPLVLAAGLLAARAGGRFERGEEGWRRAVRAGPPHGSTPLADRLASLAPPWPLGLLLLPLLPAALLARGASLALILLYQLTLSRLMPPACRYEPSCSRYGYQAYLRFGLVRGTLLTLVRLIRCSPIGPGGYDPVPKRGRPWWRPPETREPE